MIEIAPPPPLRAIVIVSHGTLVSSMAKIPCNEKKTYGDPVHVWDTLDWLSRRGVKILVPERTAIAAAETSTLGSQLVLKAFNFSGLNRSRFVKESTRKMLTWFRHGAYDRAQHICLSQTQHAADIAIADGAAIDPAIADLLPPSLRSFYEDAAVSVQEWNGALRHAEEMRSAVGEYTDAPEIAARKGIMDWHTKHADAYATVTPCVTLALECRRQHPGIPVFVLTDTPSLQQGLEDTCAFNHQQVNLINMAGLAHAISSTHLDEHMGITFPSIHRLTESARADDPKSLLQQTGVDQAFGAPLQKPFTGVMNELAEYLSFVAVPEAGSPAIGANDHAHAVPKEEFPGMNRNRVRAYRDHQQRMREKAEASDSPHNTPL